MKVGFNQHFSKTNFVLVQTAPSSMYYSQPDGSEECERLGPVSLLSNIKSVKRRL